MAAFHRQGTVLPYSAICFLELSTIKVHKNEIHKIYQGSSMSSINGIGTTYIGCADVRRDGSYITTQWIIFVFPVVPLKSMRVWSQSSSTKYFPIYYSSSEFEAEQVPIYWPHIVKMYATYIAIVLFFKLIDFFDGSHQGHGVLNPLLASFLAFLLAIVVIKITGFVRKVNVFVNIVVTLAVLTASFLVAADISIEPTVSWTKLYYFWAAYLVFYIFMFFWADDSKSKDKKRRF